MAGTRLHTPDLDIESPDEGSALRPTIERMIRTRICANEPKYLVDKIAITTQTKSGQTAETFRLWLSDGEKSIQAVLRQHTHHFVVSGEITEGSYICLTEYELLKLPRATGNGCVWVFAVSSFRLEGHDGREEQDLDWEEIILPGSPDEGGEEEEPESQGAIPGDRESIAPRSIIQHVEPEVKQLPSAVSTPASSRHSPFATPRKRKSSDKLTALSPLDPNVSGSRGSRSKRRMQDLGHTEVTPSKQLLIDQTNELRDRLLSLQATPTKARTRAATTTPSASPIKHVRFSQSAVKNQTVPARPNPPLSPPAQKPTPKPKPVKITPLSEITGVKARRNVTIPHVLAMITHVNPRILSRRGFPDSREILVMDHSTPKQVHVTVFVNATEFLPAPGTIALFCNLTTHEYNGGSLKAYVQKCAKLQWFVPETSGWQWEQESAAIRNCLDDRPEAWILPDRIWWTDRGNHRKS